MTGSNTTMLVICATVALGAGVVLWRLGAKRAAPLAIALVVAAGGALANAPAADAASNCPPPTTVAATTPIPPTAPSTTTTTTTATTTTTTTIAPTTTSTIVTPQPPDAMDDSFNVDPAPGDLTLGAVGSNDELHGLAATYTSDPDACAYPVELADDGSLIVSQPMGTCTFTYTVSTSDGADTGTVTITTNPITITGPESLVVNVGDSVDEPLSFVPYHDGLYVGGSLVGGACDGLTVAPDGAITGTPTTSGTCMATVDVGYGPNQALGTHSVTITVTLPGPVVTDDDYTLILGETRTVYLYENDHLFGLPATGGRIDIDDSGCRSGTVRDHLALTGSVTLEGLEVGSCTFGYEVSTAAGTGSGLVTVTVEPPPA